MTTQLTRVERLLRRNTRGPGISVGKLAQLAGCSKASVSKRVYDLRSSGATIYTNTRKVNGERKMFYRIAS